MIYYQCQSYLAVICHDLTFSYLVDNLFNLCQILHFPLLLVRYSNQILFIRMSIYLINTHVTQIYILPKLII